MGVYVIFIHRFGIMKLKTTNLNFCIICMKFLMEIKNEELFREP